MFTVRPLAGAFFGFEPARLHLLTLCTWAFLVGLVGDTWLEVAVRSHYANLDTRTPLIAAFLQVIGLRPACLVLPRWIGLPGIPLAAAITFTTQAVALLLRMNRRFPGLLDVGSTAWRAPGGGRRSRLRWTDRTPLPPVGGVVPALVALLAVRPLPPPWSGVRSACSCACSDFSLKQCFISRPRAMIAPDANRPYARRRAPISVAYNCPHV